MESDLKAQIKQILFELCVKVGKCIPVIVRAVKDIEDRMYEVEKENRLCTGGKLEFEFNTEKQYKDGGLVDPDRAYAMDIVGFQFALIVELERHHPTCLDIGVMKMWWVPMFEGFFRLLDFNDNLHMEEEKHHEEIIRVMREKLNEIDLDEMASEIEMKIKRLWE
ncbi:MAG: hypothetical protein ACXQTA_01335 [Candidatus Syntropharchaeales archaeon]